MNRAVLLLILCSLALPAAAWAQISVNIAGYTVKAGRQEKVGDKHWVLSETVELERGDSKLYADEVEFFEDQDRVVARGNVVFNQGKNRIAADRADFNTRTALGTFYHATGIATVEPPRQRPQAGISVPQQTGQVNDVIFFGDTVEKVASKKYKITNGGFSTCEQPTPRWNLTADTMTLYVDHYTLLKQAVLRVKGVPMLYLPVMYYPTQEDGRATGFLLPTYGLSTLRGQTIHNAFFWAIGRSHDATFEHDFFSKTGNGFRGEYRYNLGSGNDGTVDSNVLDENATTYTIGGTTIPAPASRSTTINGYMNQSLPGGLHARARANYFSSIVTNQTLNTNVNDAGRNSRNYGVNVVGSWRSYSLTGVFDRTEYFNSTTASQVTGSSPRINFSRNERPLFKSAPIYFGATSEIAHLDRLSRSNDATVVGSDRSLGRLDFSPQIRVPFTRWPFFTINTSANWRETYYTRSQDRQQQPIDEALNRQYFTLTAQTVGPVFNRVFNTPGSDYAERWKHTIEPFFTAQRTTAIDEYEQIIQTDSVDAPYGSTTSYTYGINNRLYARRRFGTATRATEIVAVEISQSYYTNAQASLRDPRYATSYTGGAPNNFSPIAVNVRTTPSLDVNVTVRAEIDSKYKELRTVSATGTYSVGQWMQTSGGWSRKFFIEDLAGFDDPSRLDHYLNVGTNLHTPDNKYGGTYSMNYDVLRSSLLQQRMSAFYNAQCCGLAFEYQKYNLAIATGGRYPSDHRFFLSFTLAGLGSFSPFSGGLGSVPR
jgi:LPS-assembly protein